MAAKLRWYQMSFRTLLIITAMVPVLWWFGGRIETQGHAKSRRAYVFWMPRIWGVESIAFAREPYARFVCINWRPRPTPTPTALVFHKDGHVTWQHCRKVDGKLSRRIW